MIIVRYSEIGLKGNNRKYFERQLLYNIRTSLTNAGIGYVNISLPRGRILIETDNHCSSLKYVFGIASFSSAVKTSGEFAAIENLISAQFIAQLKSPFCVRCKRLNKNLPFTSQEVEGKIGAYIQQKTKFAVDLSNPISTLTIELIDDSAYIFTTSKQGPGGLPVGIEGSVGLISRESSDIVAAWHMMKRGCSITLIGTIEVPELTFWNNGTLLPRISSIDPNRILACVVGQTLLTYKEISSPVPFLRPLVGATEKEIKQWYQTLIA